MFVTQSEEVINDTVSISATVNKKIRELNKESERQQSRSYEAERRTKIECIMSEIYSNEAYKVANWDGYNALPLSKEAIAYTHMFLLNILPNTIPLPELVPEPSGEIEMEWCINELNIIVSIAKDGSMSYSWLEGDGTIEKNCGTAKSSLRLPRGLLGCFIND